MSLFSSIPVRDNADDVDAAWWNTIRTKLIAFFGGGVTSPVQQTLTDNSTETITSLILASGTYIAARVTYTCIRNSVRQTGSLILEYGTQWDRNHEAMGDVGLSFTIHATTGQVSSTLTSTGNAAKLQWKITETWAPET